MFYRVELLDETEFNLFHHIQNSLKNLNSILFEVKHKYNMELIENLIKNICYCFV